MQEIDGNLWDFWEAGYWIAITTNGTVKNNGCAVMGRGVARDCANKIPEMRRMLGEQLKAHGNHVFMFQEPIRAFTFPVKYGWFETASPALIQRSALELVNAVNSYQIPEVFLPRPGCGNGGLNWNQVRPLLEGVLDHRFTVVWRPL